MPHGGGTRNVIPRKRKIQLPPAASPTLLPQSPESDMTGCGLDPGPRPGQLGLFAFFALSTELILWALREVSW